ncbi:uncharacterized protein LOC105221068 [Zeugodacus cucurbitae]|uniref:uncharacterized protein LOC105221068 n=1 Tax=Zeugodacus cucurbitae TaxID=28588 RepID=UPI0023D932E6|nr:uncharacterized protein LOC105221068 [Zeugodacus cucurbitae]XP_054085321.1 uncharacterized protein LOC105221068 [Zeugodacus cucurbitae]
MLLSKSMRITPTLVSATAARISGPSVVASLDQHRNLVLSLAIIQNGLTENVRVQSDFIRFQAIAPFTLTAVRFYADNAKREHQTTTSSQNVSAPSMPDREQVERFLFRVLALFWDVSVWVFINTKKLIDTHIIGNDSVQWYWKRMHERMAKAKKEW